MQKKLFTFIALFFVLVLFSNAGYTLTKGFEIMSLRPATDGGPYIGTYGARNLPTWGLEVGTLSTYAYRPLELNQNGNRTGGIIDHTLVQHFYGSVGLVDRWLSFGFDVPVALWVDFTDPNVLGAASQNKFAVGDVYLNLKTELIRSDHFGLAVRPFISVPTGYAREFFGNGYITGGGTLITEIRPVDRWSVSLNAGVQARKKFDFRNIEKSHQLELGLGTAVQLTKPVSLVAEASSTTKLSKPFDEKVESPIEARGAIKWSVGETGFTGSLGGGAGIIKSSGAPGYRIFAGLSFSPERRPSNKGVLSTVRPIAEVRDYKIYFETNSSSIDSSEEAGKICDFSDAVRYQKTKISVTGHADSIGNVKYNEELSRKRAEKVVWFLELLGIDKSRLSVGSESLGTTGDSAEDRRVDLKVKK